MSRSQAMANAMEQWTYHEVVRERFWSKVLRLRFELSRHADGPCWVWQGSLTSGYGRATIGGNPVYCHRLMLALSIGRPLRKGEQALHRCDNPSCVRPGHLFLGSAKDNVRDMQRKGRADHSATPRGEVASGRLTYEDVLKIRLRRKRGEKLATIADDFNVHISTVSNIANHRSWKGSREDLKAPRRGGKANRRRAKLREADVVEIRRRRAAGDGPTAIAADYPHMSKDAIKNVIYGKSWRGV